MCDCEGKVAWLEYLHDFLSMLHEEDEFFDEHAGLLLAYTIHEFLFCWLLILPADSMHSFEHFCDLIEDMLYHFDSDHLNGKLL